MKNDGDHPEGAPREGKANGTWLKRVGVAGFLFFLVKGLVWLGIFAGVNRFTGC